jgi:hypothetical protein
LPSAAKDGQDDQVAQSNMIDISGMPASTAGLLRQLLVSMDGKEKIREEAQTGENAKAEEEDGIVLKKNTEIVESSAQGETSAIKGINKPYCHRCFSKGHVKEDCAALPVYDICSSQSHLKPRCLLQKKATKVFARTYGYTVDGLGLYYIPHQASARTKGDENAAMIMVLQVAMVGDQVVLEIW